ncbi:peptidase inhibitor family I36 protein [Streptomyces stelliscabiei]|uniref:peptidase inhibitor family I36 protein n=1 Tax=Streptomyces TaxID=1883 RepID=UPI000BC686F7|nr:MULTISPECIES: peptidase inhibitor family I36 protein [Streptomyces]MDX2514826.1 peptidase inhibitor family I36 protein [Streptomyces stelliscabiei]SOD77702.1 Peptidase inhibitor family I36 [Streptomyces sp. 1222.2]
MSWTSKRTRTAIVAATATLALGAAVTDASAYLQRTGNGTTGTCANFQLCLYQHTVYNGDMAGFTGVEGASFKWVSPVSGNSWTDTYMNDKISSMVNNSSSAFCFYEHWDLKGLTFLIHGNEDWPYLNSYIVDKISAFHPGNCY